MGSYLGPHPAGGIATAWDKERAVGPRRRAGLEPGLTNVDAGQGTDARQLDDGALSLGRTRTPVRSSAAAPPFPLLRPPWVAASCCYFVLG